MSRELDKELQLTMIRVDTNFSRGILAVAEKSATSRGGMPDIMDNSVDLVVSVNSLHFWPDPIVEARDKLKKGGRIVITDWNHEYWWYILLGVWLWMRRFPGSTFYTRSETLEMLRMGRIG